MLLRSRLRVFWPQARPWKRVFVSRACSHGANRRGNQQRDRGCDVRLHAETPERRPPWLHATRPGILSGGWNSQSHVDGQWLAVRHLANLVKSVRRAVDGAPASATARRTQPAKLS